MEQDLDDPERAARGLWRLLRRRVERADLDLEAARRDRALLVDPGEELIAYLWPRRRVLADWLVGEDRRGLSPRRLADELGHRLARWLEGRNQFLQADGALTAALGRVYALGAVEIAEVLGSATSRDGLAAALSAHFARHHDRLGVLLGDAFGARLRDVVAAEYSPDLQRSILRLEGVLAEPVLDVGCGVRGALVRDLRASGCEVVGFDRHAETGDLMRDDWLAYDYGRGRWGTVISHLGFSLHFLHQHLAGSEAAFDYARAYRRILESLRSGGVFAYAPSLPFVEAHLPGNYVLDRWAWGDGSGLQGSSRVVRL